MGLYFCNFDKRLKTNNMALSSFFLELFIRFSINIIACILIIYLIYYRISSKKNFAFAYMILSTTIFFLCYFLVTVEFQLGLALGLFAIFGIIRYRTDSVPIKDMTYLFLVIALSIINALVSLEARLIELLIANIVFVVLPFVIEKFGDDNLETLSIVYDKSHLVAPERRQELILDIEERLGVKIRNISIGKIDLASNKVRLEMKIEKM